LGIKNPVLGVYATLQKGISGCAICPYVRPHGTTRLPLDGFLESLIFLFFFFRKSATKIQVLLKSDKYNGLAGNKTFYANQKKKCFKANYF
jgi:hypothetical protein